MVVEMEGDGQPWWIDVYTTVSEVATELRLSDDIHVTVRFMKLRRRNMIGDVLQLSDKHYIIRIADDWIATLAHELYHVWQYENGLPISENLAELYAQRYTQE